jgi:phage-related protein
MKEIIFYKKKNWAQPVADFMDNLVKINPKMLAKIIHKLDLLSQGKIWKEDIKYIWDKIYELRIKQSTNISRIFYFTYEKEIIILLDWIIKKDNKIKSDILVRLRKYMEDFIKINWKL